MKEPIKNRGLVVFLYSCFSYLSNLLWVILDLLPHFLRILAFRLLFKNFGTGCLFDYKSFARYPWRVSIGRNVAINRGCEFYSSMQTDEGVITLKDHAVLGPGVIILSSGHDYTMLDLPDTSAAVTIGSHAWVGGNTIILPGVSIGEGAVIGAGSVVSRDIPAYSVAMGNPARVVKTRQIKNSSVGA